MALPKINLGLTCERQLTDKQFIGNGAQREEVGLLIHLFRDKPLRRDMGLEDLVIQILQQRAHAFVSRRIGVDHQNTPGSRAGRRLELVYQVYK